MVQDTNYELVLKKEKIVNMSCRHYMLQFLSEIQNGKKMSMELIRN